MKTIVSNITNYKDFLEGKYTLEIGYPWISRGSILALEGIVNKRLRVLEIGGGGSTIFWAKNCRGVRCFETNADWYQKLQKKTRRYGNVELGLVNEKQLLKAIARQPNRFYDIVFINPNPNEAHRLLVAETAVPKVKRNGWLIINNYNKFGMEKFSYPNSAVYTFDDFKFAGRGTRLYRILA